jgi:hypothetical protein
MNSSPSNEKPAVGAFEISPALQESVLGAEHEDHGHGVEWTELARTSFVAIAAAAVWFRLWEPFPHISGG